ncbi:MAG: mandelate racemase/muconate lactonizing enzyme family protein [Bryobacteraceae bacterium]
MQPFDSVSRRHWLQCLAALPLSAAAQREASKVTVTGLEIFRVPVNRRGTWLIPRIQTSAGVTGIGDASHGGGDEAKVPLLRANFERIRGRGIFDIEHLRTGAEPEIARRGSAAAVAMSALEHALWDIRGKLFGVPACDLLGGRLRTGIRNYANINRAAEDRTPSGFAKWAEAALKAGFDAVRLAPWDGMPRRGDAAKIAEATRLGIDCIAAVRSAIGPKVDLLVDAHKNFDRARGLELARRLEPYNLFWLEEVTPGYEDLAEINRAAPMPTAGGEGIYGVRGFLPYVRAGAVDILMPDVKVCGGMLELKKIGALAEAAGAPVSPHGPASPVGNVAAAHVCASLSTFQILELGFGEVPWRHELIEPAESLVKGRMALSGRPGLGIELNSRAVGRYGGPV